MPLLHPPLTVMFVVDVAAWGAIHAGTGYIAHRLDNDFCMRDTWLTRLRAFERSGRLWNALRVHRWKDRVPEAGEAFNGGVSKRRLPGLDDAGLLRFAGLTRRAEMGHWMAAVASPLFAIWNPLWIVAIMMLYGLGVNAPFIAIQRYNRLRVEAIVSRREAARSRRRRGTSGSSIP